MNNKIFEKYAIKNITTEEYNMAKANLSEKEFEKRYHLDSWGNCYMRETISEVELQTIILNRILNWIRFFGILTIFGIAITIIVLFIL
jgi:hypothetical protein